MVSCFLFKFKHNTMITFFPPTITTSNNLLLKICCKNVVKILWTYNFSFLLDIYRFSFIFLIPTSSKSPIILRCAPRFYTTKINKKIFIEIKLVQAQSNSKVIFQINNLKKQSHKPIPNTLSKRNNHTNFFKQGTFYSAQRGIQFFFL